MSDRQKEEFLMCISSCLKQDGIFIYIDVFNDDNSTRDSYIQKYFNNIESYWDLLDSGEKKEIKSHLENYDHPSTIAFVVSTAKAMGLFNLKIETADNIHYFLVFKKCK